MSMMHITHNPNNEKSGNIATSKKREYIFDTKTYDTKREPATTMGFAKKDLAKEIREDMVNEMVK